MIISKLKRRGVATVIAGAAAIALFAGCAGGGGAEPTNDDIEGGSVTVRMFADWGNPIDGGQNVTSTMGIMLSASMYGTLIFNNPDGELVPYIAESWEETPTALTFKIRDDVTCTDGSPVTAQTVYDSFTRFISPELKSKWLGSLFGAPPYTLAMDEEENTFTFSIAKPNTTLIRSFADARSGIICGAGLEPGADFTTASYGAGPFIFDSATQGDEYVVKKNPDFTWGPNGTTSADSGVPDEIVFKVFVDATTATNALVTGELDITSSAGQDVARLQADPTYKEMVSNATAPYILMLNQAPTRITTNKIIRQAIITAADPHAWAAASGEPDAVVSTNIQSNPDGYCYKDLSNLIPEPSVKDAQELLLDNGYELEDGKLTKDGAPVVLNQLGTTQNGQADEYLNDVLLEVGFTVNFVNVDLTTFATNFGQTNYDVTVGRFGGTTVGAPAPTGNFMVGKPPSEGGSNRLNFIDPRTSDLLAKAIGATTEDAACAAWQNFNTYFLKAYALRPWSSSVTHWFTTADTWDVNVSGESVVPLSIRRLK